MSLPLASPGTCTSDDEIFAPSLFTDDIPVSDDGIPLAELSLSLPSTEDYEEHKTSDSQVQEAGYRPTENTEDNNSQVRTPGIVEDITDELSNDELGTGELRTDELGTDELSTDELGTGELCTNKLGTDVLGTNELSCLGAVELGTDELVTNQLGPDELGIDEFGTGELCTDELGTGELVTNQLGPDELGIDELGTGELCTDELGTGELRTGELCTDELGTGELGTGELDKDETSELETDELGINDSKPEMQTEDKLVVCDPKTVMQGVSEADRAEGSLIPVGETEDKKKEDDALPSLEVLDDDDDDDSDTVTETVDNLEAFEIDDDDNDAVAEGGKPSSGVTVPSPPPTSAAPSSSSTSSSSSALSSSSATTPDLQAVGSEDLKCDTPGCRHLAHSKAGLVLHLRTHGVFEVTSSVKSGETKFSYINGKYLCSLCPMTTFSRTVFGEHVRHHLLAHPYKCGHCSEGVDSIGQLRKHNRSAHRQLLVKLVINESGRIETVMSKLGPQAPPTGGSDHRPPRASTDSAKEPICIDDDGEDVPDVSSSSGCVQKTQPAPQPLRKEPLSQNFKYSLTKDGRLLCAQCRYMTAEVESFGIHVFNDIHQALNNPCGKCNQRGKRTDVSRDCTIVDQITRALLRQKELQGVPKESREVVQRGGLKAVGGAGIRIDSDQRLSADRTPAPAREKEKPAVAEISKQVLPNSPFEETMALLRTLSSDNHSDGTFAQDDRAQEVKRELASELVTSNSALSHMPNNGNNEVSRGHKDRELSTIRRLGASSRDLTGTNCGLTAKEDTLHIKSESISSEDKLAADADMQKDGSDPGCCRCLVYKATPHKRLSLEELDKNLKDKIDSETVPDTAISTSYRCGIPGCMFTSSLDLNFKLHCMVKHPGMAALTCSLCQKGFEDEDLLLDHINCEHNQGLGSPVDKGIYLCSVEGCGVSFNRVVELKAHFGTGHPHLGSFPCSFCYDCLPTLDGIMVHIQTHLKNVMKCSYCKKVFNEKDELVGHISASHEGQPKKINICIKIVNNTRSKSVAEGKNKDDPSIESLASPGGTVTAENPEERLTQKSLSFDKKDNIDTMHADKARSVQSPAQQLPDPDVELVEAKDGLAVKCEQCSFTCNTDIQLKMHVYECHTKDRATGLAFTCKSCNMATNVKETLQKHTAHHTGKTVVRFYVCPYCSKQSSLMDLIEDHVMNDHPNEPFKFEVIQDMITYLQDMMLCPVCKGGFTWKQDFLHHLGSVHRLEDLVSHLDSKFPEKPFLKTCMVPRHLFKDLIPAPARDRSPEKKKDDAIVTDPYVNQQIESEKSTDFGRDGMILRFHCEICEFSINDYPKYREHMAAHGNILDDVQNLGVSGRLSPLPTSASDIVFGGGSGSDLYGTLAESGRRKRMKLTCSLCPFECSKTLNYRRHMAIHERNKFMMDGFKCGYCQFLHDRQNCIKFHLGKYHGHLPPKICRIVGGREVDVGPDDDLMRPSRSAASSLQSPPAVDLSREKRAQKQTTRWSASWESPYSFTGRSRRILREQRRLVNRPMENIAADYMESDLPAGMIYPEPIKCPKCQFSNRVRINLVRHMKLHQNDGDIGLVDEPDTLAYDGIGVPRPVDHRTTATTSSIPIETDCIKIEADDGTFNTSSGLNSPVITLNDSVRCPSARSERSTSDVWPGASDSLGSDVDLSEGQGHGGGNSSLDGGEPGSSTKKLFKCCYCSIISKWNRRDISLHILHVHMQKRVYSCQYCSYGSSKSSAIVMNHSSKIHPQKQIVVRDELALFNAIMPVQEDASLVSVGFLKPDGVPILDLGELRRHLGLGHQEVDESIRAEKRTSRTSSSSGSHQKRSRPADDDRDQPLDLSVKIRGASNDPNNDKGGPEGNGFADEPEFEANSGVEFAEWKCKLCKFRNRSANHVKRHILCHHMRLKPFSCPYCHLYQWKAQAVMSHIDKFHPGQPKAPVSTANEKVSYLSRNMTRVFVRPGVGPEEQCVPRGPGPSSTSDADQSRFTGVCSTSFYRCKQCGFQEVRHDKTKYHVIKQHLKLGLFSCPYCRKYMWGRNYVARHIRSTHPGQEIKIQRTFDEYANYLRDNIRKIGGSTVETTRSRFPPVRWGLSRDNLPTGSPSTMNNSSNDAAGTSSDRDRRQNPSASSGSGAKASAVKRPMKYYKCFYCSFQHSLAARVQSHCLARHPTRPVKYRETAAPAAEEYRAPARQIKVELTDEEEENEEVMQASALPGGNDHLPLLGQDSPGQAGRAALPIEMYMCHYCHHLLWNMEEMMAHLCESHPDDPPEFELMQEPVVSSPPLNSSASSLLSKIPKDATRGASSKASDNLVEKMNEPQKVVNEVIDEDVDGDSGHQTKKSSRNFREDDFIFKCRLCNYHTDKVTVMRHHVMSHLLYHPYRCPYCEHAHSVKSSPITKHIKLKHPGMDPQFSCARDEEMEKQVRSTYYRTIRDGTESTVPVKSFRKLLAVPLTPKMRKPSRRAFYKCKFCGLVTHIRTDMKHHLMREIHYKPFVCGYCNYTEPSRSGMGKHFRSKHSGMVVDIRCTHDAQEDDRVEHMLEECVTRHDPDSVIDDDCISPMQTDDAPAAVTGVAAATRRNEPFKLLTKKLPSETISMHGGSVFNPFGSSIGSRFGVFPGFFGSHGKAQKSFSSSRVPKIHRCLQCSYTSTSLRPLQAHMVKHRPCRLQCGYCTHRSHYPSWIRKHIRSSHPGLAFKYCKVSSGPRTQAAEMKQEMDYNGSIGLSVTRIPSPSPPPRLPPLPSPSPSPPVSRPVAAFASIGKKAQKQQQAPALLDGVELDIALVPGRDGYYRCPQCDYQTANRSHYKMHSVIHKPRKWKCFYCNHKFPLIFRLRRHCSLKHPRLPVKWVDVATEQVCDDSTRLHSFRHHQSNSSSSTARKSFQQHVPRLKVAMFRSRKSSSPMLLSALDDDDELAIDLDSSRSQISVDLDSSSSSDGHVLWFCCPNCPKKYALLPLFVDHLKSAHTTTGSYPALEILPPMGEGELTLQRCGFCSYESFFKDDFDAHVKVHTSLPPRKCIHCQFASFVRSDLEEHFTESHPDQSVEFHDLDQPYTMNSNDQSIPDESVLYNFDPTVKLVDVCKILQDKWESV